jgi:hypothetical protein
MGPHPIKICVKCAQYFLILKLINTGRSCKSHLYKITVALDELVPSMGAADRASSARQPSLKKRFSDGFLKLEECSLNLLLVNPED